MRSRGVSLWELDKVMERNRGCKQPSDHMHTDRFQMIVSKRGYAPAVCEALEIPCGTIHTHITYQTDESP